MNIDTFWKNDIDVIDCRVKNDIDVIQLPAKGQAMAGQSKGRAFSEPATTLANEPIPAIHGHLRDLSRALQGGLV